MNKSTKGALAAAAAATLMVGGAGSLAYWSDQGTVGGDSITSGHLKLVQSPTDCDASWMLNGAAYTGTEVLSPGDELTRHCAYTVSMSGTNLNADLAISAPEFSSGDAALTGDLTITPTFIYDDGVNAAVDVSTSGAVAGIVDGAVIDTTLTVVYKDVGNENNASNTGTTDLTAALADVTVTATQTP